MAAAHGRIARLLTVMGQEKELEFFNSKNNLQKLLENF